MIGDLISAGAKLFGGFMSDQRADARAEQNVALQREFAQKGVQWKVADAKAAGVHPLYALGASTHSFAPVSVGGSGVGTAVASMGQDISRAAMAGQTAPQRMGAVSDAMQKLTVENASLQNDLLRSQIARLNQAAVPAVPGPSPNVQLGVPADLGVKVSPGATETVAPGHPSQARAVVPDMSFSETQTGLAPVPSKSVKELIEDITIPQLLWGLRNNILPALGMNQNPPARDPGQNKVWVFHPGYGEYQAVDKDSWWARAFGRSRDLNVHSGGGW